MMKKLTALLLTAAMLLSLSACSLSFLNKYQTGSSDKDDSEGVPPSVNQDDPAPDSKPEDPKDDVLVIAPEAPLPDPEKKEDDIADPPADNDEYVIRISHSDVTLKSEGETFRLSVWDSEGADPKSCTFTSDNPEIASVDEAGGEVTAVAPGTANITVHAEFADVSKDLKCIVRCAWKAEDGEEPAPGEPPAADQPALSDFFSTLQGKYEGLGSMMVLDSDLLDTYYPGLSSVPHVEEVLVQETMMSTANVAVGLVKLSSDATADDILAVTNALQGRIDTQADGGAFYPESCETWKQGVITSASKAVGMFVYPNDAQAMADLFTAAYSN